MSTVRSSIQKRGLTFRSAVTGSGVVVDDTGEGVTLFGAQPVLRTAVSLKNSSVYFQNFIIFISFKTGINLNKIPYFSLYEFLILIKLPVHIRTKQVKMYQIDGLKRRIRTFNTVPDSKYFKIRY